MQVIGESILHLLYWLAMLPFIPFALIWLIGYIRYQDKSRAMRLAMDITTLFLIAAVSVMYNLVFSSGFGFYWILLFFLIGAGLLGNAQKRIRGKLVPQKIARSLWRIGFVIMSALYVLFVLAGITKYLFV